MGWAVQLGEQQMPLEDLPIKDFQAIASRHGLNWLHLLEFPGHDADAMSDLVTLAAGRLGVDAPAPPESIGAARKLLDVFVKVEDDLPKMWVDGDPLAADQTTD